MKKIILFIFSLSLNYSIAQTNEQDKENFKIAQATGDLDKDGIDEKIEIWNRAINTYNGLMREIRILKKEKSNWKLWKKYDNCIPPSKAGNKGDAFSQIRIIKGVLNLEYIIDVEASWSEKYRYQNNEFEMIGYSSKVSSLCNEFRYADFNLSTVKIIVKKEIEKCKENGDGGKITRILDETFHYKNLKINLNNRFSKEIEIISPKHKIEVFFYTFSL